MLVFEGVPFESTPLGFLTNIVGDFVYRWLIYIPQRTNKLFGTIPASLSQLQNLTYLSLRSNSLTGTLPPALGSLTKLQTLDLALNSLNGSNTIAG